MNISRALVVFGGLVVVCLLVVMPARVRAKFYRELETNNPPVAVNDSYTFHVYASPFSPKLTANDSDPDSDPISISGFPQLPAHGTVYQTWGNNVFYNANYGYTGTDSFTYTLCDNQSACTTGSVSLTIENQPPDGETDSYDVHGSLNIGPLLANDSDPDGDSITIGDVSHERLVTSPQHGTLNSVTQPDRYIYSANYGYTGSDSFTYNVCDAYGACSTAVVSLDVEDEAPVGRFDFYVVHGTTTIGPFLTNDFDPDGDQITIGDTYHEGIATYPEHGTLGGLSQADKKNYYPSYGYSGSDSFTYNVCDSLGVCSTATVYVLVLPGPGAGSGVPYGCECPTDPGGGSGFNPQTGGLAGARVQGNPGPSADDPVNLVTGRESYTPIPDLAVYNPTGSRLIWRRAYIGNQALAEISGYGSPGLSRGWVHNYDLSIQATSGSWGNLQLIYPNGATETLTPELSGGSPTGAFTTVAGAPYIVTGVSGSPTGVWQSVTVTWKDQTQWKFTQLSGTTYALNQITNRTGQSLDFTWNSTRALTQVADHGTSTTLLTLAYSNGQLTTATDAYSRKVTYTFSAASSTAASMLQSVSQVVTSSTSNPPAHWTYSYTSDKGKQLNTITVPSPTGTGNSTATINYDAGGKITSLVDANGNQRVYTYNSTTTGVQVKDPSNNVVLAWTQKFNSNGMNTGFTDAASHSTTIAYGDTSNPLKPTSFTDRNGHETTYTYDQFGNIETVTTPRSVTITLSWDYTDFALGRLTSIQEGSKPATTVTYYEPSGLVETITRPEPNGGTGTTTTELTYDSLGNVLTITGPGNDSATETTTSLGYTTDGSYTQDAKVRQPITITDNLSHVTHVRYDSQGRVTSVTDPLGNETGFSYNLVGQPETITYPATGQTGTGHSHVTDAYLYPGGPLTTITSFDESNTQVRQVTRGYGVEGELLSLTGSTEPVTVTYDAARRLKTLIDGNSHTTTYAYNSIGKPSSITMPGSEVIQFTSYDNGGNLLQRVDGNSVTTNYVYDDDESLLTDIEYPASTSLNVHFDYDSYGRRSAMTDSTGSQSYTYGNLDELLSVETTYTSLSAKTISYSYYPNGSRESTTTPAGTFDYSYDEAGRPASMTNPFSETTSWSYENNDWLATQTLANGAVATYTRNELGQVTELLNQISSTTISDFSSIAYDGIGNRTSVTASIPGATSLNGTTDYTYDTKNQLTQETSTRNGNFTDNFGYDTAGNPTTFKGATKSYNSNNQQTGTGFSHDGNGNPTTYGGATLTFDPENRLTSYGSVLTAGYNGDGLRAWKQNSSTTTYFLYDGILPIVELNASGSVTASNTFGAQGLISRRASSSSVFYSFDSEGNVSQRSNASGNVLSNYLLAAHGAILSGTLSEPFGYKAQFGYYTDSETGLQPLTFRYYDQSSGRFLTRDPISYYGGINLYSYVRNTPTRWQDPTGQDIFGISVGGSAFEGYGGMGPSAGGSASSLYGYNTTDGEIGGAFSYGYFYPGGDCDHQGFALGGSASIGVSAVISNADDWDALGGGFDTHIVSIGPVSVEVDYGANGIWVAQISPGTGLGRGLGYAHFHTYTPPGAIGTLGGLGSDLATEIDKLYGGGYCGCR